MKKTLIILNTLLVVLTNAVTVLAQSGTWTNASNSVWSDSTNWLDNIIASGAGNVATFTNEFAAAVEVNLDSPRTVGELRFVQGVYTITNDANDAVNVLTLQGASQPRIFVDSVAGTPATLRRVVVAGTQGFVLDGGGQLNLFKENTDSNNVITGGIVLSNGTIQVQGITDGGNDNFANTLALLGVGDITFYNGTLNVQPAPNTSPEYGVVSNNFVVPAGNGTGL